MPLGRDIAPGRAERPCRSVSELFREKLNYMTVTHHPLTMTIAPTERTTSITTGAEIEDAYKPFGRKWPL